MDRFPFNSKSIFPFDDAIVVLWRTTQMSVIEIVNGNGTRKKRMHIELVREPNESSWQ